MLRIVGGEDDGEALLARHAPHGREDDVLVVEIESRGRLVEHERAAAGGECPRDHDELPLAAADLVDPAVLEILHAEHGERLARGP